jgi:hypothetical protein
VPLLQFILSHSLLYIKIKELPVGKGIRVGITPLEELAGHPLAFRLVENQEAGPVRQWGPFWRLQIAT